MAPFGFVVIRVHRFPLADGFSVLYLAGFVDEGCDI